MDSAYGDAPKLYPNCNFRGIAYLPHSCEHGFREGCSTSAVALASGCASAHFSGDDNNSSFVPVPCPCVRGRWLGYYFPRARLSPSRRTRQNMGSRGSPHRKARSVLRTNQAEPTGTKGSRRPRCDNQLCQSTWAFCARDAERCISFLVPANPVTFCTTACARNSG